MSTAKPANDWLSNHCNGSGPHRSHSNPREVRLFPLGGGANSILCLACWGRENRYRYERVREGADAAGFPQVNYFTANIYATENT